MTTTESRMLRLRTLGGSTIEIGGSRVGPDSAVLFGLLLYLAVERGRAIPRGRLREMLWPDVPEDRAGHSLRQLLYRVRQMGLPVDATAGHVTLDPAMVEADFAVFEGGSTPERNDNSVLMAGVGPFLEGYAPRFSEPFCEWVEERRGVVHGHLRRALLAEIGERRRRGDWAAVEHLSRDVLAVDPLNEEATLCLAESMALAGSKVEAVSLLDRYLAELNPTETRRLDLPPTMLRRRIAEGLPAAPALRTLEGPFLGRGDSMEWLHNAMQRMKSGQSQCCHVWGPAGIGKTRLVEEFTRTAIIQGIAVERVNCRAPDRHRPMSVFVELVPNLLRLPGAAGCSPATLRLLGRFTRKGAAEADPWSRPGEAEFLAASVCSAVLDLIDAVTAEQRLAVVVEDTHAIDPRSAGLLKELSEWAGPRRLLLISTSRQPPSPWSVPVQAHRLRPLVHREVLSLLHALTYGLDSCLPDSDALRLVQLSEGNPFYARELVGQWLETQTVIGLPPSLLTLVALRLSELSTHSTLALQAVAVLGRYASLARLEATLGYPAHMLVLSVQELERAGLIVADAGHIACKHDVIADVAVEKLGVLSGNALHRAVASVLESDARNVNSPNLLWDCALHWHLANEPNRAADFGITCAEHLLELGLARDAVTLLGKLLPLCRGTEHEARLLQSRAVAQYQAVDWQGLKSSLLEKHQLINHGLRVPVHDDEEMMLLEASWRCDPLAYKNALETALGCVRSPAAPVRHRLTAAVECLKMAGNQADGEVTEAVYREIRRLSATEPPDVMLLAEAEMIFNSTFGDVETGGVAAAALLALRKSENRPGALFGSLLNASFPLFFAGRVVEAEQALLDALNIAHTHRLATSLSLVHNGLMLMKLLSDDIDSASFWYGESVIHAAGSDLFEQIALDACGVDIALSQGELAEAEALWQRIATSDIPESFPRGLATLLAARIRMQVEADRMTVSDHDVGRLGAMHLKIRALGGHDRCAYSLFSGLKAQGNHVAARQLYKEYVYRQRRELTVPISALRTLGQELESES